MGHVQPGGGCCADGGSEKEWARVGDGWLGAPIDDIDESLLGNSANRSDLGGEDADLDLSERLLEEDDDLDLL